MGETCSVASSSSVSVEISELYARSSSLCVEQPSDATAVFRVRESNLCGKLRSRQSTKDRK